MSTDKNNLQITAAFAGNFTRGAVKRFEENIVNEENYLEKADADLKHKNKVNK